MALFSKNRRIGLRVCSHVALGLATLLHSSSYWKGWEAARYHDFPLSPAFLAGKLLLLAIGSFLSNAASSARSLSLIQSPAHQWQLSCSLHQSPDCDVRSSHRDVS